jgi:DNA-3-methyladenine glycosylase
MEITAISPLPQEFYIRNDVVLIAKELLGKILFTSFNNELTAGIITETEAYAGASDKASHAYKNKRTARTEIMYRNGGYAYVYLCYGMHSLFNIVTSVESDPQAVLIRGIKPLYGIDIMARRTGRSSIHDKNGIGPGNVAKLLAIQVAHSGVSLFKHDTEAQKIWIRDDALKVPDDEIRSGPRIGVGYAEEDAFLPYRFQWIKNE